MRGILLLVIMLASVPVCLISPYHGVLMWYWVSYFNPHRFTFGFTYNLPVALIVALPTLAGLFFAKKSLRSLLTVESALLFLLWLWFAITYIHASNVSLFALNMPDANYEISHISKIFLMTFVMIVMITSKERLRAVLMVSAGSMGLLALRGAIFGVRTAGESRVWGPPDSFLSDNNGFALALNVCLAILFYLALSESRTWLRVSLWLLFVSGVAAVMLTYSRGGLLGLGVVVLMLAWKSHHKILSAAALVVVALAVVSFAPAAWMERMNRFMKGDLDQTANQRLVAWETAWRFSKDYPIMGGGFDALPNVAVFQRYQPRPLPGDLVSCGPHSIYFQLLADQGFVGLFLFLALVGACFWTLFRIRRQARQIAETTWVVDYTNMIEIGLMAFMASGAFLGFVYLDIIYQIIGTVAVIKFIFRQQLVAVARRVNQVKSAEIPLAEEIPASA